MLYAIVTIYIAWPMAVCSGTTESSVLSAKSILMWMLEMVVATSTMAYTVYMYIVCVLPATAEHRFNWVYIEYIPENSQ